MYFAFIENWRIKRKQKKIEQQKSKGNVSFCVLSFSFFGRCFRPSFISYRNVNCTKINDHCFIAEHKLERSKKQSVKTKIDVHRSTLNYLFDPQIRCHDLVFEILKEKEQMKNVNCSLVVLFLFFSFRLCDLLKIEFPPFLSTRRKARSESDWAKLFMTTWKTFAQVVDDAAHTQTHTLSRTKTLNND